MAGPNYMHPRHKGAGILVENSRMYGRFEWESDDCPSWAIGPAPVREYYPRMKVILTTTSFRPRLAGNCMALRIFTIQRSKSLYLLWPFSIEPLVTRPSGPITRVKTTSSFGLDCFPEAAL